jgi:hypothetical protein
VPLKRSAITILLLFHILRLNENINFLSGEGLSNSNFNVQFPGLRNAFSTASSQILNLRQREKFTIFNIHNYSPQNRKISFWCLEIERFVVNLLTS